MRPQALDLLVCPTDQSRLRLDGASVDGEVETGHLCCEHGHGFEVRDAVPVMVESAGGSPQGQEGTIETFSAKWGRVNDEELSQRFEQQYRWYVERFGFRSEAVLADFLAGLDSVLEVGTGLGGDAARFARLCGAEVIGLDLSESIFAAQRHFGGPRNLSYVRGDILDLPFAPESFDFVSADQVIHHTPDAPRAFAELASRVRPGGHLAVYVYRQKSLLRELADTEVRKATTAMSVEECLEFSEQITELGRELSRVGATIELERGVPLLGIEPGKHDVQRLIYWCFLKCFWNEDFSEGLNTLVNFDWYHPPYASRHTEEEVRGWCGEGGLEIEHLDVGDSGISVLAFKPDRR